ncbi:alpha/beta hydrolase-fold protein [Thioclava sp. GXIMD4215]|uniref:alpha/beta hydrolase-fold protein n=1 Tax=Thioclava sp. GXIMD4215 TaxID=3131928 RepID=UPI00311AF1E8
MVFLSRRSFLLSGVATGVCMTSGTPLLAQDANGFQAAASAMSQNTAPMTPGLQGITAICEVTGGGEKVYAIAVEYDTEIDPESLSTSSYSAAVVPTADGYYPGMPAGPSNNDTEKTPVAREIIAIYTNDTAMRRLDQSSVKGRYVIAEFAHADDLSQPTTDSEKVRLTQTAEIRTLAGASYPAADKQWSNVSGHGTSVAIRGVDAWEQNHWWWDDSRSAWLEYSIYLPKSFLAEGGEEKSYPLILAITHSGTSYDGTCKETLTETCIASIWGMPEQQAKEECVVITPRYERTTMNDYWEHTADVENTYRLVQSLLSNTWNYGNPNLSDRRDKVLKIDPARVYCTGWSMGAMTSLWLMAHHPETFAAGLIIAGQQRPQDVVGLADQNLLIITGTEDQKSTPWTEACLPVWRDAGAKITRPDTTLDPDLIFPVTDQKALDDQVNGYLDEGGNITFLTFEGVDHMASARKFFYISAARDWLLSKTKA